MDGTFVVVNACASDGVSDVFGDEAEDVFPTDADFPGRPVFSTRDLFRTSEDGGQPPPSCSKVVHVPSKEGTTPSKEPDVLSLAPAGLSGQGRGLPPRASGSSLKPVRKDPHLPPKGPKVSMDEKMEKSIPLSDNHLPLSGSGYVSSVSCEVAGRPKDTAKKMTVPRNVAPKDT
ncbi:hypothetical protein HPB47_006521 [Ixodes persulcatus]|uniref:Uncharacterized protein n=1 Tax=Ixodes persulcatus TaxID=34615 RepID=A0AC60PA62_IXOPE|nr:hypothetical protein HPB47_006521 [Ixodes persulcatus]